MRTITRLAAAALGLIMLASGVLQASAAEIVAAPIAAEAPVSGPLTQVSGMTVVAIALPAAQDNVLPGRVTYSIEATKSVSICPPAKPGMATCMAMARLDTYRINVLASTQVLDKNRKPLSGMPEVGDRINAYGALGGVVMDAQIVRDLDKPLSAAPIQLENLRVIGVTQGKDGIQVDAVSGMGPCWNYGAISRVSMPCPMGTEPAPNVREAARSLSVSNFYSIAVPGTATVLDKNRKPMKLSLIKEGDTINAYGTLVARGMLKASIVRDLSVDGTTATAELAIAVPGGSAQLVRNVGAVIDLAVSGGTAPYAWSATGLPTGMELQTDGAVACLVAPCPQPARNTARIVGTPTRVGSYPTEVVVRDAAGSKVTLSIPFSVARTGQQPAQALRVSVSTDQDAYRAGETMKIAVDLKNVGTDTVTQTFSSSCQADYDVLPGFSLRSLQLCALSLTSVTLRPGETKTFSFTHDLAAHPLPRIALPATFEVVGRVAGVGEASKKITLNPALAL